MEKKYIYRKHLREPAKFFLTLGFIAIIGGVIGSISIISTLKDVDKIKVGLISLAVLGGVIALMSLEFLLIYFTLYRRFKNINVVLGSKGIIYNNSKSEIKIPYENIKELKFPSIKYTGGWLKIIHTEGNIRLTVVLENIGDMVKNLKGKLDEKNKSNVYDEKAMYNFFKTAEYSDQSWERMYEKVKFNIIFSIINLVVAGISSAFITEIPVKIFMIAGYMIGSLIPYVTSEIIIGRKLATGASKEGFSVPKRDKDFENKIYKLIFGIYSIVYIVLLIVVCLK